MALVLAAVGLFVYKRVGNELLSTVDQSLVAQSREEIQQRQRRRRRGQRPDLRATVRFARTAAQVAAAELCAARRPPGRRRGACRQASLAGRAAPAPARRLAGPRAGGDQPERGRGARALAGAAKRVARPPPSRAPDLPAPRAARRFARRLRAHGAAPWLRSSSCADARKPSIRESRAGCPCRRPETRSPASPRR